MIHQPWVVSNNGGDMIEPAFFEVVDASGIGVNSGEVFLFGGESTEIGVGGYGEFTLIIFDNGEYSATAVCEEPIATEEPTPESPLLDVNGGVPIW